MSPDPTIVISVRGCDRDTLLANPKFLYIGRPVYRGTVNWKGSIWSNPFKVGMKRAAAIRILGRDVDHEPRAETVDIRLCLAFHRAWLEERSGLMGRIGELRGRILGCWCACWVPGDPPIPCHGWTLARLANKLEAAHAAD
jgi:hypothetical protein